MHRLSLLTRVKSSWVHARIYGWIVHDGRHCTPRQGKKKTVLATVTIEALFEGEHIGQKL